MFLYTCKRTLSSEPIVCSSVLTSPVNVISVSLIQNLHPSRTPSWSTHEASRNSTVLEVTFPSRIMLSAAVREVYSQHED